MNTSPPSANASVSNRVRVLAHRRGVWAPRRPGRFAGVILTATERRDLDQDAALWLRRDARCNAGAERGEQPLQKTSLVHARPLSLGPSIRAACLKSRDSLRPSATVTPTHPHPSPPLEGEGVRSDCEACASRNPASAFLKGRGESAHATSAPNQP